MNSHTIAITSYGQSKLSKQYNATKVYPKKNRSILSVLEYYSQPGDIRQGGRRCCTYIIVLWIVLCRLWIWCLRPYNTRPWKILLLNQGALSRGRTPRKNGVQKLSSTTNASADPTTFIHSWRSAMCLR